MTRVSLLNRQRRRRVSTAALTAFAERLTRKLPPGSADEVSIVLVSDRTMRRLNSRWRGIDATTDVLSFPSGPQPDDGPDRSLGDIVISVERAAVQARDAGHSLARELRILVVHGYLHLLGHDHETDDGTMLRLQRHLVRALVEPGPARVTP